MRDIRTKKYDRKPKIRSSASKMPKEPVRAAALEAKSKVSRAAEVTASGESQASPTEYASEKLASAEEWTAGKAGDAVSFAGRKLARTSYKKIKERRREAETAKDKTAGSASEAAKGKEEGAASPVRYSRQTADRQKSIATQRSAGILKEGREIPSRDPIASGGKIKVRVRPESYQTIRTAAGRDVKTAFRIVRTPPLPSDKVKTVQTAVRQKQALRTLRTAGCTAAKTAEAAGRARAAGKTAKTAIRGVKAAVRGAIASVKALGALLTPAGGFLIVFIVIVGIIASAMFSGSSQSEEPLSQEVLTHTPVIQKYAAEYGIPGYVSVLQAIMMQESGGRGTDPMQASECPYNTKFPNSPNGITEPEYSIQVGVQYYAGCVKEVGCKSTYDMDRLKLSIQGYNYGNGYITWALHNHGGYSGANAHQFSQEQAASHGWAAYGDPEYVPHVLRYYSGSDLFEGLFGNGQIVAVAKAQLGNEGGEKFWSWYGFDSRVDWCACFVSWCADQSGLIASGSVPKFAYCPEGIEWFKSQGRWKDRGSYMPVAGTIVFFDWPENGVYDGVSDHVGIVEKCEDGVVYTVEGNSGDAVRERSYSVDSGEIMGYGIIN